MTEYEATFITHNEDSYNKIHAYLIANSIPHVFEVENTGDIYKAIIKVNKQNKEKIIIECDDFITAQKLNLGVIFSRNNIMTVEELIELDNDYITPNHWNNPDPLCNIM